MSNKRDILLLCSESSLSPTRCHVFNIVVRQKKMKYKTILKRIVYEQKKLRVKMHRNRSLFQVSENFKTKQLNFNIKYNSNRL